MPTSDDSDSNSHFTKVGFFLCHGEHMGVLLARKVPVTLDSKYLSLGVAPVL